MKLLAFQLKILLAHPHAPLVTLFKSSTLKANHRTRVTNTTSKFNFSQFSPTQKTLKTNPRKKYTRIIILHTTMKLVSSAISLWTFFLVVAVPTARGLWMDLPTSGVKCISEEIHNHLVVMVDYYTFIGEEYEYENNTVISPTVSIKVTDPHGKELFHKEKADHGQFGFTATEAGNYQACMEIVGDGHKGKKVSFGIDWKTGIAAKDWESVARKEKIQGLELELKKLEESVHAIHESLTNLMDKDWDLSDLSRRTNARVAWYSITSLCICIVVSVLQVCYLRRYFRNKKLI